MQIVDSKHHILTNYKKEEAVSYDHAPMIMEVKHEAVTENILKVEIPKFEDKEGQLLFQKNASETEMFTHCFETLQPVWKQSKNWLLLVKKHIQII